MKGQEIARKLADLGIIISYFCDRSEEKIGTNILNIPCIALEELKSCGNISVIIGLIDVNVKEAVRKDLLALGVKKIVQDSTFAVMDFLPHEPEYTPHVPIGHYYSPFANLKEIREKKTEIIAKTNDLDSYHDIDLNIDGQLELMEKISAFYGDIPLWTKGQNSKIGKDNQTMRYQTEGSPFPLGDASNLHGILRIFKPKRMIEVGSGFSSAMTLDTNEHFLNHSIDLTFIEPYPNRLKSLLKPSDNLKLLVDNLQNIPLSTFETLEDGDIMFFDSTHVSKVNSDVNYIFFEILPRLKSGVIIHFHDIFRYFEYPWTWIEENWAWNESYLLRAFLQNNHDYEILLFNSLLRLIDSENKYILDDAASFWMRKK